MSKKKHHKISYEPEADIVRIELLRKDIDHAKEMGLVIVHFSKDRVPVYLEIVEATRFLKLVKGLLPKEKQAELAGAAT